LKNLFSIFIFIFYLSWIFAPVIKVSDYLINLKEYKEQCINKEKVKLHCDGKCQLNKSIEENETEPALSLQNYDFTIAFCPNEFIYEDKIEINKINLFISYINLYTFTALSNIFRPPIH